MMRRIPSRLHLRGRDRLATPLRFGLLVILVAWLGMASAGRATGAPSVVRSFGTNRVSSGATYETQLVIDPGASPPFALIVSEIVPEGWTVTGAAWAGQPIETNTQGRTNKWVFSAVTDYPVGTGVLSYVTSPQSVIERTYSILGSALYSGTSAPIQGVSTLEALDGDADGMPDDWERLYFGGSPTAAEASGDVDGDGAGNLTEYRARTDPRNSLSYLGWTGIAVTNGELRLRWRAGGGSAVELCHRSTMTGEAGDTSFYYAEHAVESERESPPFPVSLFTPQRFFILRQLNGR